MAGVGIGEGLELLISSLPKGRVLSEPVEIWFLFGYWTLQKRIAFSVLLTFCLWRPAIEAIIELKVYLLFARVTLTGQLHVILKELSIKPSASRLVVFEQPSHVDV